MITPTRWRENGCPHVRPHPALVSQILSLEEFTFTSAKVRTLSAYLVEKNRGCEPWVKKLQSTCADQAANPDIQVQ